MQGYASVLESAGIILHVIVIIVGVREEILVPGIYEGAGEIGCRQQAPFRVADLKFMTSIDCEISW